MICMYACFAVCVYVCVCVYCRVCVLLSEWGYSSRSMTFLAAVLKKFLCISSSSYAYIIGLHPHIGGNHFYKWRGLAQNVRLVFGLLCLIMNHALLPWNRCLTDRQNNLSAEVNNGTPSNFGPDLLWVVQFLIKSLGVSWLSPRDLLAYNAFIKSYSYKTFVLLDISPSSLLLFL